MSLTYKNLTTIDPITFKNLCSNVDALELRVDLLENIDEDFIKSQVAFIRKFSYLPIVYTVRSQGQGGKVNHFILFFCVFLFFHCFFSIKI